MEQNHTYPSSLRVDSLRNARQHHTLPDIEDYTDLSHQETTMRSRTRALREQPRSGLPKAANWWLAPHNRIDPSTSPRTWTIASNAVHLTLCTGRVRTSPEGPQWRGKSLAGRAGIRARVKRACQGKRMQSCASGGSFSLDIYRAPLASPRDTSLWTQMHFLQRSCKLADHRLALGGHRMGAH